MWQVESEMKVPQSYNLENGRGSELSEKMKCRGRKETWAISEEPTKMMIIMKVTTQLSPPFSLLLPSTSLIAHGIHSSSHLRLQNILVYR